MWCRLVLKIFIGRSRLNVITFYSGERNDAEWNDTFKLCDFLYNMFVDNYGFYKFEMEDKVVKFTSNVGIEKVPYPIGLGEVTIQYLTYETDGMGGGRKNYAH